jgi:O-antigen/teichoic acid export membrane protein
MIAFPENAIGMLFGETYLGATGALQILSIGAVFMSLNYILGYSIIGIGKPGLNTKISFVTMIINLMLDLALIPFIGMYGVAV